MTTFTNHVTMTITDLEEHHTAVEKHQLEVQNTCGTPTALRLQGTSKVKCPYTGHYFECETPPGHVEAECENRETILTINGRDFIPNYGFTIYDCTINDDIVYVNPLN